jgi:hypothetical protein
MKLYINRIIKPIEKYTCELVAGMRMPANDLAV